MSRTFTVDIIASLTRRLYIGVTSDLLRRLDEHRTARLPSFTARYRINRLVYFEQTPNARAAIERETEIKKWSREKKIQLIESTNAGWLDLSRDWYEQPGDPTRMSVRDRPAVEKSAPQISEPGSEDFSLRSK